MKMRRFINSKVLSLLAVVAVYFVNTNLSTNCYCFFHQPKVPAKLLKN
ncbi:cyclic lactone autoinducer peptide [Caloranaerobacter sp. DY30410]